jgi:hypothetical protein
LTASAYVKLRKLIEQRQLDEERKLPTLRVPDKDKINKYVLRDFRRYIYDDWLKPVFKQNGRFNKHRAMERLKKFKDVDLSVESDYEIAIFYRIFLLTKEPKAEILESLDLTDQQKQYVKVFGGVFHQEVAINKISIVLGEPNIRKLFIKFCEDGSQLLHALLKDEHEKQDGTRS